VVKIFAFLDLAKDFSFSDSLLGNGDEKSWLKIIYERAILFEAPQKGET